MRWQRGRATAVLAVLAVLTVLTVGGCGSDPDSTGEDPAAKETPTPTATSTRSNAPTPCLGDADDTDDTVHPPNSSPGTQGYLGLSESEAKKYAGQIGQEVRVAGRDGECFALTMDYSPERVNLYLENDEVVAATIG
ncbi:MAG: hypothetical protein LH630_03965 [Actinomycetia bacterium]|nr:hypothetical protein [Actinomycetes bacterium]